MEKSCDFIVRLHDSSVRENDMMHQLLTLYQTIYILSKRETLHIYSTSKISLILFFRNTVYYDLAFICSKHTYNACGN